MTVKIVKIKTRCVKNKCKTIVKNFDLDLSLSRIRLVSFHPTQTIIFNVEINKPRLKFLYINFSVCLNRFSRIDSPIYLHVIIILFDSDFISYSTIRYRERLRPNIKYSSHKETKNLILIYYFSNIRINFYHARTEIPEQFYS